MTINVELGSYWDKSDFAVLSFQSHSRTLVTVPNRTVGAVVSKLKAVDLTFPYSLSHFYFIFDFLFHFLFLEPGLGLE